jgi:predicted transcriptional regulator
LEQEYLSDSYMKQDQVVVRPQPQQPQLNRRSRMETYCDILRAIGAGAQKPTHIMYKANLSWTVMQTYIKALESQNLITTVDEDGRKVYRLTEKGYQLLTQFMSIRDDLNLAPE